MEDDLKIFEDNLNKHKTNKNLFSIPLKFWGKPFLGLAQLSKIFLFYYLNINRNSHYVPPPSSWLSLPPQDVPESIVCPPTLRMPPPHIFVHHIESEQSWSLHVPTHFYVSPYHLFISKYPLFAFCVQEYIRNKI